MRKNLFMLLIMMLAGVASIAAQTRTVSGVVLSADDNEPILGATVMVNGTRIGGTTDIDGKFSLTNIPANSKTLTVSFIGMKTREVPISKGLMSIVLESSSEQLEEVVVTGMHKMDKRLFTGAATKVNAQDVRLSGMADISRSLEGRAAGVSVQNVSGTFGTAPKIRVRGATRFMEVQNRYGLWTESLWRML